MLSYKDMGARGMSQIELEMVPQNSKFIKMELQLSPPLHYLMRIPMLAYKDVGAKGMSQMES